MKSNIFIPKTINVGYQTRSDTYTGKLAYVIYYDEKGVLRKETSWQNWRNKDIPNEEFENIPTEGFVLNKKVGDYSGSWGEHRQAYCRVYDPRNFEFEITIENLLYILENTSAIKGKGLEGEFVYSWDGKDLLLMPVDTPDYKQIQEYNALVHSNEQIKAKDLIVGATYLTKDNQERIYIGKYDYYSSGYKWIVNGEEKISKNWRDVPYSYSGHYREYEGLNNLLYGKYFWFAYKLYDYNYVNGKRKYRETYNWKFEQLKSVPKGKFISCIDEKCNSDYADIFDAMESSYHYSPYDESKDRLMDLTLDEFVQMGRYSDNSTASFKFISCIDGLPQSYLADNCWGDNKGKHKIFEYSKSDKDRGHYGYKVGYNKEVTTPMKLEEIFNKMKPQYIQRYLENGREYERVYSI